MVTSRAVVQSQFRPGGFSNGGERGVITKRSHIGFQDGGSGNDRISGARQVGRRIEALGQSGSKIRFLVAGFNGFGRNAGPVESRKLSGELAVVGERPVAEREFPFFAKRFP